MYYRDLYTQADYRRVIELERLVWGYTDGEDIVPVPLLVITVNRGGILVGAFDDHDVMVGFVYSLPGVKQQTRTQWSHMLGVLPEHRNAGVGRQLKLEQRRKAIELGVDLVEWTYDPLQAMNAHLNFNKLGVVVCEYEENIYGASSSPLHAGTPTDRFVAEWWVRGTRVETRIEAVRWTPAPERFTAAVRANTTRLGERWLECQAVDRDLTAPELTIEIPMGFGDMQLEAAALARDWRRVTAELFLGYLARGYRVVEFLLDRPGHRGVYLLQRQGD